MICVHPRDGISDMPPPGDTGYPPHSGKGKGEPLGPRRDQKGEGGETRREPYTLPQKFC